MGVGEGNRPVDRPGTDPAWAGALPTADVAPARPPIVVACDEALVRAVTRAILRAALLGPQGLVLAVVALVFGYAVVAVNGATSWWQVGLAAVGIFLLQVLLAGRSVARRIRRMLPVGSSARSWYAAPGVVALETGSGRTDLRAGSLASARRRGPVTSLRLRRNPTAAFLPSALLTDEDLAFLAGPASPPPPPADPATSDLPLLLVVTDRTRRDLRRAIVVATVRQRQMVVLLTCAGFLLVVASWAGQWAEALVAVVLLALGAAQVVSSLRLCSRSQMPGALLRAGFVGDRLRLQSGDDVVDELPLASVRQCHVGRHHVRLDLGRERPHLFLPRELFPATDLAELQRRVAGS